MFGDKVLCVGQCNASCLGNFFQAAEQQLIIVFWNIWVVLKRTFKCFTAVVQKGPIGGKSSVSTVEEAEAGGC